VTRPPLRTQPTRPDTPPITRAEARHVVWHYAGRVPEPGEFTKQLIILIDMAGYENRRRLALAFPGLAAAVDIARNRPRGIRELERIAFGRPSAETVHDEPPDAAIENVGTAIEAIDLGIAHVAAANRDILRERIAGRRTAQ